MCAVLRGILTVQKYYIDHNINSIQNFINKKTLKEYDAIDVNVYQSNIFHTKMMRNDIKLSNYLFNTSEEKPVARKNARRSRTSCKEK